MEMFVFVEILIDMAFLALLISYCIVKSDNRRMKKMLQEMKKNNRPVVNHQPVVNAQPVVNSQPIVNNQSVVNY